METLDYPKIKEEFIKMHNNGHTENEIVRHAYEECNLKDEVIRPIINLLISENS